jgi:hypothetical protein
MRNLFGGISPFIKLTLIKAIPVAGYKFHLARRDWAQAEDGVCGGEKAVTYQQLEVPAGLWRGRGLKQRR